MRDHAETAAYEGPSLVRASLRSLPFAAIFAVVFLANLAYSQRTGRFASEPTYDDVIYLADAYIRLAFAPGNGLFSVVASFWHLAPHAIVSTLTAMAGYWAFGPSDVSPYLANGWVLALYFVVITYLTRPLGSLFDRVLLVATLAFVPVAHAMVTEFRPDMAAGLVFALALWAICTIDFRQVTVRRRVGIVALAAFATIMKPSAVVLTIPALGFAVLATLVAQGALVREDRLKVIGSALISVALYAAMLLPFAILLAGETVSYIYDVLITDADIWTTPGDRWFHLNYHLFGPGGHQALGHFRRVGLWVLVIDLLVYVRFPAYRKRGVLPYTATLVVVFVAMSVSREKTVFQGSFFYLPFLLAAVAAFVRLVSAALALRPELARTSLRAALAIVLAVEIVALPLGGAYFPRADEGSEANRLLPKVKDAIVALRRDEWLGSPSCSARAMSLSVTNYDPLTPETVQLSLAKAGIQLSTDYNFLARSLDEAMATIDLADLVLMVDPGASQRNTWTPISAFVPEIFDRLSNQPGVRRIEVGTYRQKPYWLFVKPHCEPVSSP
ncbi:hypothetical protein OSH08_15050 [Kaistia geumhonensis]|uniref:Glycosyltransferase RgtA/B/C/D-like domain-containing protein n=1 Tax=Kaistia geumhonensis TaxID=410839 RepID=A0ABU0M0G4_9HYPH|nr:hypothetical protein [Kaistia geumhonensis]MCX5480326.1 hypothetical protein [Kaistia geumhonensis]MDQ0514441.1 hypothetical protein [Kaistia geumhonensis]